MLATIMMTMAMGSDVLIMMVMVDVVWYVRERWYSNRSWVDDHRESTDISSWQWLVNCHKRRHHRHRLTDTDRYVKHRPTLICGLADDEHRNIQVSDAADRPAWRGALRPPCCDRRSSPVHYTDCPYKLATPETIHVQLRHFLILEFGWNFVEGSTLIFGPTQIPFQHSAPRIGMTWMKFPEIFAVRKL